MTDEEIKTLFSSPGLYILADGRCPGCTAAVMAVKDPEREQPRVFMMTVGEELSQEPASWKKNKTTSLAGGPFSVENCKLIEEQGQQLHDLQAAVGEAKHLLMLYRDAALNEGLQNVANSMQILLDTLTTRNT